MPVTTVRNATRRRPGQRGSAMLEIALSLNAFLLLTLGVMEFAMAVYAYNFCSYASGEATRWASVRGAQYVAAGNPAITDDDIKNFVLAQGVGFNRENLTVRTSWLPDNNPGSIVQVKVSYSVIPLVGLTLHEQLQVSNTSQTVIVH